MGRARGQNAIMALGTEASYGVPPASGYRKVPFVSSNLGAEQALIESDLLGQGRAPSDPTYDIVTNDGDVVVPMDTRSYGLWLRLLLGAPVTTVGPGEMYTHTFSSGKLALPSGSIEIGLPDRPTYSTHYGVRANTLQIQMARGGLTSSTLGLIAKGETVPALTSSAGVIQDFGAVQRFAAAGGYISVDGVQIGEVVSARLNYSNGMEKDETIRPDAEINDVDPGMPSASIGLTLKFADTVLLNKATGKVPVGITLTWPYSATMSLSLTLPRVFLPRSKRPISGPGGIQIESNGIASTEFAPLMVATLINDVASYA